MRRHTALWLAVGVLLATDVGRLVVRAPTRRPAPTRVAAHATTTVAAPPTTTTVAAPPTTTTTAPPPARVVFGRTVAGRDGPAEVLAVLPDGNGLSAMPGAPATPKAQRSDLEGLVVSSQVTSSSTQAGAVTCAFYRCTQWGSTSTSTAIFVSRPDGADKRQVTPAGVNEFPAFSPDGTTIAFTRGITVPQGQGGVSAEIALIDTTGTVIRELVAPAHQSYRAPAWSPDGMTIATTTPGNGGESSGTVVLLPVDGAPGRTIATGTYRDLAWSADGRFLVAQRDRLVPLKGYDPNNGINMTGTDLWVIPVDGTAPRQLTHLAPATHLNGQCGSSADLPKTSTPMWSRDGTQVAFLNSYPHPEDGNGGIVDISVVNADGTGLHTVYRQPSTCHPDFKGFELLQLIDFG